MNQSQIIELGVLLRPHGVKGAIKFKAFNPDSKLFGEGVILSLANSGKSYEVDSYSLKPHSSEGIIKFRGIETFEDAKKLEMAVITIPRAFFENIEALDEFYVVDLVGLESEEFGVVENYYFNGAGQAILVFSDKSSQKAELPFNKNFIKAVDLMNKKITVSLPEYL